MPYRAEIINIGEEERNGAFILTLFGQIRNNFKVLYTKTDTCEITQATLDSTFDNKAAFIEYSTIALRDNLEAMINKLQHLDSQ